MKKGDAANRQVINGAEVMYDAFCAAGFVIAAGAVALAGAVTIVSFGHFMPVAMAGYGAVGMVGSAAAFLAKEQVVRYAAVGNVPAKAIKPSQSKARVRNNTKKLELAMKYSGRQMDAQYKSKKRQEPVKKIQAGTRSITQAAVRQPVAEIAALPVMTQEFQSTRQ